MRYNVLTGVSFLLILWLGASGQPGPKPVKESDLTRILIVFDASESMTELWQSDTKYRIAVKVLTEILDSLAGNKNLEVGLRVYGPKRAPGPDCEDSYIMVPIGINNLSSIKSILNDITPGGTTPIAYSLEQTVSDFGSCKECRNVVILITDGLEACNGDPCEVSRRLQKIGIFLRPFIVGIGGNMKSKFNCIGNYYDATDEDNYQHALETIVATTLDDATAQINLLDGAGNPTHTNVHVTLYNNVTGSAKYSFIHSLSKNGFPDTLKLDPLVTYDVVVQTIPPLSKEDVWIEPGKHTSINLDARQGFLSFITENQQVFPCIIRRSGTGEAIHVQPSNRKDKYLADRYDITVLTTPRMNFYNIDIEPDIETRLSIPSTGSVKLKQLKPVTGSIYMLMDGDSVYNPDLLWVDHVTPTMAVQTLNLQPGNYIVVYRLLSSTRQMDTVEKRFQVYPGEMVEVDL
jgi:Ca-activated chloride channel family protein